MAYHTTQANQNINTGQNSLQSVHQQLKMVEKEILFMIEQIEIFDLFPVVKPKDYVDPETGQADDTWFHPCKVCTVVLVTIAKFLISYHTSVDYVA